MSVIALRHDFVLLSLLAYVHSENIRYFVINCALKPTLFVVKTHVHYTDQMQRKKLLLQRGKKETNAKMACANVWKIKAICLSMLLLQSALLLASSLII